MSTSNILQTSIMKTKTCILALVFAVSVSSSLGQDTWSQKAGFGGSPRLYATGFSIDGKVYIGTGVKLPSKTLNDLWEYDSSTDACTQKADFGGVARYLAAGFAISNKGYIGTGLAGINPRAGPSAIWCVAAQIVSACFESSRAL